MTAILFIPLIVLSILYEDAGYMIALGMFAIADSIKKARKEPEEELEYERDI